MKAGFSNILLALFCIGAVNVSFAIANEPIPLAAPLIPGTTELNRNFEAKGLNVDIVRAAFKKVNLDITVNLYPWKRAKRMTELGKVAALFTCSYRPDREQHFLYSSKIRTVRSGIYSLVESKSPEIRSLADIGNKSIGVTAGYNLQDELVAKKIAYFEAPHDVSLVSMLLAKRFDYIYSSEDIVRSIIKRKNRSNDVQFFPLNSNYLFVCFSRKWSGVVDIAEKFERGLTDIRADHSYNRIIDAYR